MNNNELNLEEKMNKFIDESSVSDIPKELHCPYCNERLMYLEPDDTILYCKKCDKYFKNNNGTVGEETVSPYLDENALY